MRVIVRLLIACVLAAPSVTTARRPDHAHPRSPELALAAGTAHVTGGERPSPHQSAACGVLTSHESAPTQAGIDVLNAAPVFPASRAHHPARGRAPPQTTLL